MKGKTTTEFATNIDDVVSLLDQFASSETGRMKVSVSERIEPGDIKKEYHLGRCDINSAFACGIPFDVLDDEDGNFQ